MVRYIPLTSHEIVGTLLLVLYFPPYKPVLYKPRLPSPCISLGLFIAFPMLKNSAYDSCNKHLKNLKNYT